jgi:hypothetical protein
MCNGVNYFPAVVMIVAAFITFHFSSLFYVINKPEYKNKTFPSGANCGPADHVGKQAETHIKRGPGNVENI